MSSNCLVVYPKHNLLREQKISQYTQVVIEAQSYVWRDEDERLYWRKRAEKMLREHMRGQKSVLVEAALRAHAGTRNTRLVESRLLSEGFFSKIADGLGKATVAVMKRMPGYKTSRMRNWWIFGGGGAAEDKRYEDAYDQARSLQLNAKARDAIGKYFKEFEEKITSLGNAFPNIDEEGSGEKFRGAIDLVVRAALAVRIYAGDTKVASDLAGAEPVFKSVLESEKDRAAEGQFAITKEEGDKLIAGLRKRLMYWDRKLEQRYALAMEHVSYKVPTLAEAYGLNEAEEERKPTADDLGKKGKETSTMEYLKSNFLPACLAIIGASGLAFYWLVHQAWFIEYFYDAITTVTETEGSTKEFYKALSPEELEKITKRWSEGATLTFREFLGPDYAGKNISGMSIGDMQKMFFSRGLTDAGGNPTKNLLGLAADPEAFARDWKDHFAGNFAKNPKMSLGDALPLSSAWGKAGGTLTLKMSKVLYDLWPKVKMTIPGTSTTAVSFIPGATATAMVAFAPWAAGVGAALLVAGIGTKLMRRYGAKNSRASYISAALKMIDDINLPETAMPDVSQDNLPEAPLEAEIKKPETIERAREVCERYDDPRLEKILALLEQMAAGKVVREPPPAERALVNIVIQGATNSNISIGNISAAVGEALKINPVKPSEAVRAAAEGMGTGESGDAPASEGPSDALVKDAELYIALRHFYETLKGKTDPEFVGSDEHFRLFKQSITTGPESGASTTPEPAAPAPTPETRAEHRRSRLSLVEAIYGSSRLLEAPNPKPGATQPSRVSVADIVERVTSNNASIRALFERALEAFKARWVRGSNAKVLTDKMIDKEVEALNKKYVGILDMEGMRDPNSLEAREENFADEIGTDALFQKIKSKDGDSAKKVYALFSKLKDGHDFLQKALENNESFEKIKSHASSQLLSSIEILSQMLFAVGLIEGTPRDYMKEKLAELGVSQEINFGFKSFKSVYDFLAGLQGPMNYLINEVKKINHDNDSGGGGGATASPTPPRTSGGSSPPSSPGAAESARRRDDVILERWAVLAGINKAEARR